MFDVVQEATSANSLYVKIQLPSLCLFMILMFVGLVNTLFQSRQGNSFADSEYTFHQKQKEY
jgi:surface polysaccharide O-acyltransferase-like enzyme